MIKRLLFLALPLLLIFTHCKKDEQEGSGYFFIIGHSGGAIYYSNLPNPEVVEKNYIHYDVRGIDLNGDSKNEINIISSLDTISNDTVVKVLMVEPHPDADSTLQIALVQNSNTDIQPFLDGESVDLGLQNMVNFNKPYVFARYENIIHNGAETTSGIWNGRQQQYFVVSFKAGGTKLACWIEITVNDFDKYALHNYASFLMPE